MAWQQRKTSGFGLGQLPFIFGGNTGVTAADLPGLRERQQMLRAALLRQSPRNLGEGLNALGHALALRANRGRVREATRLAAAQKAREQKERLQGFIGAGMTPQMAAIAMRHPELGAKYLFGMRRQTADQNFRRGEREAGQTFATNERLGSQDFRRNERLATQEYQGLRDIGQHMLKAGMTVDRLNNLAAYFEQQYGRPPTREEAAEFAGLTPKGPGVVINTGDKAPISEQDKHDLKQLPAGVQPIWNAAGNKLQRNEDGTVKFKPIAGSRYDQKDQHQAKLRDATDTAKIVERTVDKLVDSIDSNLVPVTGLVGKVLGGVPGTAQYDFGKNLETLMSNVGFTGLKQMRELSQNGAAVGQLSNYELKLFVNAVAAIDQGITGEELKKNLAIVKNYFTDRRKYMSLMYGTSRQNPDGTYSPFLGDFPQDVWAAMAKGGKTSDVQHEADQALELLTGG